MKRRGFFGVLASIGQLFGYSPQKQQRHFFADYSRRPMDQQDEGLLRRGRVLVDGKEYRHVWLVDTRSRSIETYDIFGDHSGPYSSQLSKMRDLLVWNERSKVWDKGGIWSRTVKGDIELWDRHGKKLL